MSQIGVRRRPAAAAPGRLRERGEELRAIAAALAAARAGEGSLLLVEGPAGIGKTRLLDAARCRARELGLDLLSARGAELEQELPFGVVRQLLEARVAGLGEEARTALLDGHAARAVRLLDGAEEGVAGSDPLPELLHALHWLCATLAARRPLVLVVDDAHWADGPSLRWLHYLAGRVEDQPLLVLVAARPAEPGATVPPATALGAVPGAVRIAPAALSAAAVAEAVRERLDVADEELCAACHRVTGGNPFLLRELLTTLRDGGATVAAVEAADARDVSRSVLARVRRLPQSAEGLVRALALLGDDAPLDVVAELAGADLSSARANADALAAAGLLDAGPRLRFVHPLVRASIAAQLPAGERAHLHGRAARLLHARGAESGIVALHLDAAEPSGDPWAVATLRSAAGRALRSGAPEVAARHLRRALAEPASAELRPRLLLELGRAAAAQLGPGAEEDLTAALDAAPDDAARAVAALELGRVLVLAERPIPALATLDRGVRAARGLGDSELLLRLEAEALTAGNTSLERARLVPPRAEALLAQVTAGATVGERLVLAGIVWHWAMAVARSAEETAELAERALAGGATLAVATADAPLIHSAAAALTMADRLASAENHLTAAMEEARRRGSVSGLALAACWRSWAGYRRGALAAAEEDATLAVRLSSRSGRGLGSAVALSVLIECRVARGAVAEARDAFARWHEPEPMGETTLYGPLLASEGRLHALAGDLPAARRALEACRERHELLGLRNPGSATWRAGLARLAAVEGDGAEARRLAHEELEIARAWGGPRNLSMALRTVAALSDDGARRRELLEEAVALGERSEARLERVRALEALGAERAAVGGEGDLAVARELLRAALDGAAACGAAPLVHSLRAALVRAGARPRRLRSSGVGALTPSERRIAGLAAEGLSNRAIAEREFLAVRTVELHLTRSYRKLGIDSRARLAAALRDGR
ncbi:ATP-binding protein [Conexibacter arvalis]|uniref:DNA-binding CsgD family transcriptional regulator n=1 Tax=Conexibacter arvalis TaxID=912552 RepID=A0A840II87_9ACTN|nr:AAA family ATPase [Conexibacter arvalis]MBB4664035.1 DNA-binding CsgD family transcriptional regulator [Conexibacter arvalis]